MELSDEIKKMFAGFLRVDTPFTGERRVMAFLKSLTHDRAQRGK